MRAGRSTCLPLRVTLCTLDTETSFRFPNGGGRAETEGGQGVGVADAGLDSLTLMSPCLQTPHVWGRKIVFAGQKFSTNFMIQKKSEIPVQQQEF